MATLLTRGAYALPGTSLNFKTGTWRSEKPQHKHWAAPCHSACPAGEDAQAWLAKVQEHKPREAWEALTRVNPMPAVTGRVCPHPCESACNRGQYDESITIHGVERWLGDQAIANRWTYPEAPKGAGGRIAVVGAGPAGLSAAYHLRRRGFEVTLFDAMPEAGGLLRSAIPLTRLPRDVLDAEIARIMGLGIDFQPRHALGRDLRLDDLRSSYRAVFLGIGAGKSREWSVDGAVPGDYADGLHLLKEWIAVGGIPMPKAVAIHGGGNTAVDLARVWKRAGVAEVHVITASALPGPGADPSDVLNVVPRELKEAIEEGIVFHEHRTIQRLLMRGSKVVGLEMVRLRKLPDGKGRMARVAFEGTETVLHVDMVVPAIGEVVEPTGIESLMHGANYFRADAFGRLKDAEGVLVGGDSRGDRGTVSAAIGDGRKAAEAIDAMLSGRDAVEERRDVVTFDKLNLHYFERSRRVALSELPVEKRTDVDEIEGGYSPAEASREADRCLSCGNCLACDNCWTLCPDSAVLKMKEIASDGSHYRFDYDYCKGCGVCAVECPCGFIEMVADD
ncbi:MAG: FAD-dependent oxidoreductase [Alphaproteobacteria bacterium]|nr:FAD-dependent oxidoreductase [Alphaproteobacteria bacterium]